MGAELSKQIERRKAIAREHKALASLLASSGDLFPGSDYRPPDRSHWISLLGDPHLLRLSHILFPATHDSATDRIGLPFLSRPFAQCQSLSIRAQLSLGVRALDLRVQRHRRICHGQLQSYPVDRALDQILAFLSDHPSEIILLDIRTEFGHDDPPAFDAFLLARLGDRLIPHDDAVFSRALAEILPKQIICVWRPRKAPAPAAGGALWAVFAG